MLRKNTILVFCLFICNISFGQNEYFGILNYQDLIFSRLSSIPSVTWLISDNSVYDQKNHRYFFLGSAVVTVPWYLYTVDAISGAVLNQVICPANYNSSDNILGLQFDNESGILYALYSPHATGEYYFSIVDPSTGNVTPIAFMSQIESYATTQSSYSSKNHLYFLWG